MFAIIGILIVFGAVIGGYLMEHGHLLVLYQPAELVIIGGAAVGTILIANPLGLMKAMLGGIIGVFKGSHYSKSHYLEVLKFLSDVFVYARRNGMAKLEADVDEPGKSQVFAKHPKILKDHHAMAFFCDTLRMAISGAAGHFELNEMMELDMEVTHHEGAEPAAALQTVADALPGLGIVAAVLGVVITMGSLGGPPEEIGHKVAAALVGTFLGILLCYGLLAPIAAHMNKINDGHGAYLQVMRMGIIAFVKGMAPSLAIEFARRAVPPLLRPTFKEVEGATRGGGAAAAPSQAA